jgi:hypothetical protein
MVELQTGSGPAPTTAGVFPFPLLPLGEHLLFAPLAQLAFESVCAHAGAEFSAAQLDRPVILRKYDVALKAGTLNRAVSISRLQLARMRAETTEAFFCDRSATVIAAFAIDRGPLIAKMPCRTRAGTSHTHIAGDLRGIAVKSGSADGTYRIGSMRMCINGGAGWALRQLFAFRPCRASAPQRFNWTVIIRVSAASAAAIVCTSARRRSRISSRQMRPELLKGSVSGPRKIVPGDNRPAIRRTMLDDLTAPPKKRAPQRNGGSVREWRYHRTIPLRSPLERTTL